MKKLEVVLRITQMWPSDRKWAKAVGNMALKDLLHAGLPQTFIL